MKPIRVPVKMNQRMKLHPLEKPKGLYTLRAIRTNSLAGALSDLTMVVEVGLLIPWET